MTIFSAQELLLGILLNSRAIPPEEAVQRQWATDTVINLFQAAGIGTEQNLAYPPPHQELVLDVRGSSRSAVYAVDLVLETEHEAIMADLAARMQELTLYPGGNVLRWAVGISYSDDACKQFERFAAEGANRAIAGLQTENGVTVLVVTVPPGQIPPDPPCPGPPDPPPPDPPDFWPHVQSERRPPA
ncbi:MAG: hypothetical protein ACM3XM_00975 [Mycobacterium leprae]